MANTIDEVVIRKILNRSDTAVNWTNANTVLDSGEIGIEYPSRKFKIGDGITAWNDLTYSTGVISEDVNNILVIGADGYLYVAKQIDDNNISDNTTYSSTKIEEMVNDKAQIVTISSASSTLLKTQAGKNKYNRYTSGSNTTVTLSSAQNYEEGQVFNIKAVNAPMTLATSGVSLNLPTGKLAKVPKGGVVTIVVIGIALVDIYGTLENA